MNTTRKLSRRDVLKLGAAYGGGALLVSCGKAPSVATEAAPGKIELEFVTHLVTEESFKPGIQKIVDGFMSENPNVAIRVEAIPWIEMNPQTIIRASAGNAPDVRIGNPQWVPPLAEMGAFEPLEDLIAPSLWADMEPILKESGVYKGVRYSVILSPSSYLLFYNKILMERAGLDPDKPPQTFPELLEMARKVGALGGDIYGYAMDATKSEFSTFGFWIWLWAHGGRFRDGNGKIALNAPAAVATLRDYADLFHSPNGVANIDVREGRNVFAHDKIGFTFDGTWERAIVRDASGIGEAFDSHFGVTTVPVGTDGKSWSIAHCFSLEMFTQCEHKPEAGKFMGYMLGSAVAESVLVNDWSFMPPLKSQQEKLLSDPYIGVFVKQLPTALPIPADNAQYMTMTTFLTTAMQEATVGGVDPQVALDKAQENVVALYGE